MVQVAVVEVAAVDGHDALGSQGLETVLGNVADDASLAVDHAEAVVVADEEHFVAGPEAAASRRQARPGEASSLREPDTRPGVEVVDIGTAPRDHQSGLIRFRLASGPPSVNEPLS